MKKMSSSLRLVFTLSVVLLLTLVTAVTYGSSVSNGGKSDDESLNNSPGVWQSSNRSVNEQAYCDTHHPYTVCTEWCEGPFLNPTGILCCIDDALVDMPGMTLNDCRNRL